MDKTRNAQKTLVGNFQYLGEVGVDGKITLKCMLNKLGVRV
jgi:hypothetical protein